MLRHSFPPKTDPRLARFLAGASFCAFGTALACAARIMDFGAAASGVGIAHPILAGVVFALAGDLVMAMTLPRRSHLRDRQHLVMSLLAILSANALFATALGGFSELGLPTMGLIGGIYLAGCGLRLFGDNIRPLALLSFAGVLGLGSYLAYVVTFGLPMPLWPSFIVG